MSCNYPMDKGAIPLSHTKKSVLVEDSFLKGFWRWILEGRILEDFCYPVSSVAEAWNRRMIENKMSLSVADFSIY